MEHEMIDQYNLIGEKINVIDKKDAHKLGLWHKAIHVWIINDNNEILLQYRCKDKSFYPNAWDCSFAGHVGTGESSLETVLREGKEELGIDIDAQKLEYLFTNKEILKDNNIISKEFVDIYLLRQNFDLENFKFQKEEVSDAKYVSLNEFFELVDNNELIPHKIEYMVLKEILNNN